MFYFLVLSDPSSVCLNTTSLSPYNPLSDGDNKSLNQSTEMYIDETNCNACICVNGQPRCSNIWCGLPNCLRTQVGRVPVPKCELHEVSWLI